MSTYSDNENEDQENQYEIKEDVSKPRTRLRFVDLMRVEDTLSGQKLFPFELEVKQKIASVPSAYQALEEAEEKEEKREGARRKLACLIDKAELTPNQLACYQFVYVEELTDKEIANRLSISERGVRRLKQSVIDSLKRSYEKERLLGLLQACKLTKKQRQIFMLRYGNRLVLREIAVIFHTSINSVDKVLSRVRKKIIGQNVRSADPKHALLGQYSEGGDAA